MLSIIKIMIFSVLVVMVSLIALNMPGITLLKERKYRVENKNH